MERTAVQRLAGVLKVLVTVTIICNLVVLLLVPGLINMGFQKAARLASYDADDAAQTFLLSFFWVWEDPYTGILSTFLLVCGCLTAVILWQGRRVLGTILDGTPFSGDNAGNMLRAGICCLLISLASVLRVVWSVWYFSSATPLFTYNALFCPIFLMGGLLCMVMSALFRQAAELKAENDLTI